MRIGKLTIAAAVLAITAAGSMAQNRKGTMPDAMRVYYQYQNCHNVYDMLVEQDRSGNRLNDADAAWAKVYEDNAGTGAACPAPPPALAARAAGRTVQTAQGLDKTADYAARKDPAALYEIAYAALVGATKDLTPQQGLGILRMAADAGDMVAAFQLSQQYFNGLAGKQDYAGGLPWLLKAAEAGHIDALFQAGSVYANGMGTKKDLAKAFGYFRRAAEQGHVFSTYLAAQMANEGHGVKQDPALAYRLGRNLADQGEVSGAIFAASALMKMKDFRQRGDEVLYWMDLATRDGDDEVRAHMTRLRPQVVSFYNRVNAPPEYRPRERKACPMKTVCLVNQFTRVQQCTTNKDYWSDCDG